MVWAVLREDVILRLTRKGEAVNIGPLPKGIGLERLRYDGNVVVDLADLEEIHARHLGGDLFELHAVPVPGSQKIAMKYVDRDRLAAVDGEVVLLSEAELEARREALAADREAQRVSASFGGVSRQSEVMMGILTDLIGRVAVLEGVAAGEIVELQEKLKELAPGASTTPKALERVRAAAERKSNPPKNEIVGGPHKDLIVDPEMVERLLSEPEGDRQERILDG